MLVAGVHVDDATTSYRLETRRVDERNACEIYRLVILGFHLYGVTRLELRDRVGLRAVLSPKKGCDNLRADNGRKRWRVELCQTDVATLKAPKRKGQCKPMRRLGF